MIEDVTKILRDEEGFRSYVYDDATGEPIVPGYTVVGHPTIWWGLCVEKGRMPEIPSRVPTECLEIVAHQKWMGVLDRARWIVELSTSTQIALWLMAYQMGVDGLFAFKDMLAALKAGDVSAARDAARDSDWARQAKTAARAARVAALFI